MEFHLVSNQKENCHHDHILFNVKGNGNIVFSVQEDHGERQLLGCSDDRSNKGAGKLFRVNILQYE